jgi:methylmalonyl-CoA/ethylmalonyl-CoA epimerase
VLHYWPPTELSMSSDRSWEFHHIGVACRSIFDERRHWASLGYDDEGAAFSDPVQGISGLFMVGGGPRIELLEPLGDALTLAPWIKRGIKLYHLGYLVSDIAEAVESVEASGGRVTVEPVPAVAFGLRRIAFVMFANGLLGEFIEKG